MTEIDGLAPMGYRPMWEGEIVPDTAIFKSVHKDSALWKPFRESAPGSIGDVYDSDEDLPCAVPADHVPVFNAVQVPEGEDDPVEIPEGFRQLGYDEKIPYYALWWDDSGSHFLQVEEDIVGYIVGDAFTSDTVVIARIIPEGYDALDNGDVIKDGDQWIRAGDLMDAWEKYQNDTEKVIGDDEYDREFIWIRKRETANDKIRRFMEEAIALIEKYGPAFEEVGATGFAESAINDLREIINASKG